ncbi:MAG TPA: ROK family protein, partial [Pyrinomonadaceae bacterium]
MTTPRKNFIGINVSSSRIRAAVVDEQGAIIQRVESQISSQNIVPQLATIARDLRPALGAVVALGVALPGLVNRQTDRVVDPRGMPVTMVEDLHGELMRATGLRGEIENDANAAAYGEFK